MNIDLIAMMDGVLAELENLRALRRRRVVELDRFVCENQVTGFLAENADILGRVGETSLHLCEHRDVFLELFRACCLRLEGFLRTPDLRSRAIRVLHGQIMKALPLSAFMGSHTRFTRNDAHWGRVPVAAVREISGFWRRLPSMKLLKVATGELKAAKRDDLPVEAVQRLENIAEISTLGF